MEKADGQPDSSGYLCYAYASIIIIALPQPQPQHCIQNVSMWQV